MDLEDIAGYSLRRKLGSGSAGTVWQVRDLASGRNAVLKRVPITAIPDQEKLREDLTILQRIRHPHIARLLEFRETRTEWLIISQYVVAGSLAALLTRRPPLSPGELVTLLTPLAEALDHLHRSGLTHGRLHPRQHPLRCRRPANPHRHRPTPPPPRPRPPPSPTDDLRALATLAHQAGGNPAVFTPTLFTTTPPHDLPRHLLTLSAPAPIDLAFPQDPPPPPSPPNPHPPTTPSNAPAPPSPHAPPNRRPPHPAPHNPPSPTRPPPQTPQPPPPPAPHPPPAHRARHPQPPPRSTP